MRRQEGETTEHSKSNGDQLYVGGRQRGDDLFIEKKVTFCFNRPRNPDADARSRGVGSSKDFEICGILEKEPRPVGHISYQVDRHGYLPKVKIENSAQMLDRVNNRSAWTVSQSLNRSQQKL
jgi:hypothetical protein